jgi:hypothetical protein
MDRSKVSEHRIGEGREIERRKTDLPFEGKDRRLDERRVGSERRA